MNIFKSCPYNVNIYKKEGVILMARGAKKTLHEKIEQKENLIESLSIRLKKEKEELNELIELQKTEELNELRIVLQKSGMQIADIIQMILCVLLPIMV